jgi:hypothetical protein
MSCCAQKKLYSDLCEKCKLELAQSATTTIQSDYPFYPEYDSPEGWEAAGASIKCECGAEKSNQPGHSSWCPKGTQ